MTNIEVPRYLWHLPLAALLGLMLILAGSSGPGARQAEAQAANGLEAEYFDNADLTSPILSRTDPNVDFSWGKGYPAAGIGADTFSVRWTGQVEAPAAGAYVFYTRTTDGARLWVDGQLVIDKWIAQRKAKEWSGRARLSAGRHDVKMEYYEGNAGASARLSWSGPGLSKQVIPQSRLFLPAAPPAPAPQCSDGADNDSDTKIDHSADPGCESATDGSESPDPTPPPPEGEQRWSDPATWGGTLPTSGEKVTIPAGKTVLLDQSTPPLGGLDVKGDLVIEDDYHTLTSDWIVVQGKLQVGTENQPIRTAAKITLTGINPDPSYASMGARVLGVMGGTLDVHGEDRAGWTRLNATAQKGSTTLTLENASTGWHQGDRIAIASTDYDPAQTEEATVTAVSGNTVTLGRALARDHYGQKQTFGGRVVDERAEVALLSRNVKIEGTESADGFGGQVMAMDMQMDGMNHDATVRIEGAELTRMGQQGILRRYPVHFHMMGDSGENSYLKDSSLHHTFNRCVTVHGTNRLEIQRNVCYDHIGHGFFFEDGAEVDNVLEGNLGMGTREPEDADKLLESDRSPATYWITNPDNVVRNNVSAGSEGVGFWLAFPEHPTGLFASLYPAETASIWPRRTPLGTFAGNVAHSNWTGLNVDDGPTPSGDTETTYYNPRLDPTPPADGQGDSAPVVASFEDYTGYRNRDRAVWLRGRNHRLVNATLADNAIGATFASNESVIIGSLVVGETANKGTPKQWEIDRGEVGPDGRSLPFPWNPDFPIRGYEFYDGRVGAENTTFVNFTPNAQREASGLGVLLEDDFSLHPRNFAQSLTFVNAKRFYMPDPVHDGDRSAVFVDQGGSVSGTAGAVVTANNEFLTTTDCTRNAGWNAYICPPGTEHVSLISETLEGGPEKIKPLTITREPDGQTQTLMGCCDDSTDAVTNLLADRNYEAAFNGGTPARFEFVLYEGGEDRARWLRVSVPYAQTPKVTKYGCDVASTRWCGGGKATSLADLEAKTLSSYYYDATAKRLYLKLYSDHTDWEEIEVQPAP